MSVVLNPLKMRHCNKLSSDERICGLFRALAGFDEENINNGCTFEQFKMIN